MATAAAILESIDTAIYAVTQDIASGGGMKSYSINGRAFAREDSASLLGALIKLRAQMQREVARGNSESEFLLANLSGAASHRRFEL